VASSCVLARAWGRGGGGGGGAGVVRGTLEQAAAVSGVGECGAGHREGVGAGNGSRTR
jgi:hypothetical protein